MNDQFTIILSDAPSDGTCGTILCIIVGFEKAKSEANRYAGQFLKDVLWHDDKQGIYIKGKYQRELIRTRNPHGHTAYVSIVPYTPSLQPKICF